MARHSIQKRHFEAIGAALMETRHESELLMTDAQLVGAKAAIDSVTRRLADVCESFNPDFRRDIFLRAAGVADLEKR